MKKIQYPCGRMNKPRFSIQDKTALAICGMVFLTGIVFGISMMPEENAFLTALVFSMSLIFSSLALWIFKRPGTKAPRIVIVFITITFLYYVFISGGVHSTGYIWGLLVPVTGFFLLGLKPGFAVVTGYLVIVSASFIFGRRLFPDMESLTGILFARYAGIYITSSIISFIYEKGRVDNEATIRSEIEKRAGTEGELYKLSRAVEQSSSIIVITDLEGRIEYANRQFEKSTGYRVSEVLGLNPRFLKSGVTPQETYSDLWNAISSGNEWRGELQNRRKDGSFYWEQTVISPLRDPEGNITHYLGVKEDISSRRESEKKLEELYGETSRLNHLMTGREDRILELKKEVNELSLKLNRRIVYPSAREQQ